MPVLTGVCAEGAFCLSDGRRRRRREACSEHATRFRPEGRAKMRARCESFRFATTRFWLCSEHIIDLSNEISSGSSVIFVREFLGRFDVEKFAKVVAEKNFLGCRTQVA